MSKRPPSTPPNLPGFEYVQLLGSGGFADVFLYQQHHPKRQVAVKVLLSDQLSTVAAKGFTKEANLMAQLTGHPSIVSVYEAGVSLDGRPYLVMENCSRPNLQVRHRRERFSEAETLKIGVQIASALESAHRMGILHRDVKPANILVNEYGRPKLTDFGISATTDSQMSGMSIPWSPPEAFLSPPQGDASSDVYALAATLYTLLTNRTPFEVPGASNTQIDVIQRIQSSPLQPTGRPDISEAFEAVLQKGMAKSRNERYRSALDFARALQRVQIALELPETPIDVAEEEIIAPAHEEGEEDRTRFRGVTNIDAQSIATGPGSPLTESPLETPLPDETILRDAPSRTQPGVAEQTVLRADIADRRQAIRAAHEAVPPLDDTLMRSRQHLIDTSESLSGTTGGAPVPRAKWGKINAIIGSIAVVGVIVTVVIALLNTSDAERLNPPQTSTSTVPAEAIPLGVPPQVEHLEGSATDGEVAFTWVNPEPEAGDRYLWRPVIPGESFEFEEVATESVTVPADTSGRVCIEVVLVRSNGASATEGVQTCAP